MRSHELSPGDSATSLMSYPISEISCFSEMLLSLLFRSHSFATIEILFHHQLNLPSLRLHNLKGARQKHRMFRIQNKILPGLNRENSSTRFCRTLQASDTIESH